jgi:hypothetical protein
MAKVGSLKLKDILTAGEGAMINDSTPSSTTVYSSDKVESIIPDALADLSEDTTHRTVTDTEKTTWNGKADATHIHTGTLIFTYNL